jgi:hypothetical protein
MNKYNGIWLLFLGETAFFLFFSHSGKIFTQAFPIIPFIELGYILSFSKAFRIIKELFPAKIGTARLRYLPAATGLAGFAIIGLEFIGVAYILVVGCISSVLTAVGKTLVYKYIDELGINVNAGSDG